MKIIQLVYKEEIIQSLVLHRSIKRKKTILEMWRHLYGKSFKKAKVIIIKTDH